MITSWLLIASAMPVENWPGTEMFVMVVSVGRAIDALYGLNSTYAVPAITPLLLIAFHPAKFWLEPGLKLPQSLIPLALDHVNACSPCAALEAPATTPLSLMSFAKLPPVPPGTRPMSCTP